MALFQLDPDSIAARARAAGLQTRLPTLWTSVIRGMAGFTLVSVAGFAPWPILSRWFGGLGEVHLYIACTALFIALSGICLHRLIIGRGSLSRFYKLFTLAFTAYAMVWVGLWMGLRGDEGILAGLLGGTAAMGAILCVAFGSLRATPLVIGALFVCNTAGYHAGSWIHGKLAWDHEVAAMLLWGVCYGMGFGAGLGVAFHLCQSQARAILQKR
jgi:hypothetical protein